MSAQSQSAGREGREPRRSGPRDRSADGDLVPRLWTMLRQYQDSTGVQARLRIGRRWPSGLAAVTTRNLARFVEDSLQRISGRGGATHVDVELKVEDDSLVLVMNDDAAVSAGFGDPSADEAVMQDLHGWALLLGGHVAMLSIGSGTMVRLAVPRPRGR